MYDKRNKLFAFTLIEILIAVAIIAIIIAVVAPNFIGIRQRARDTRRKSDVGQIQKAIELYKADQNPPLYPADGFMDSLCNQCWSQYPDCAGNVYMRKLPCDPLSQQPYVYVLNESDNLRYFLAACLENSEDNDRDPLAADQCNGQPSYSLAEP